MSRTICYPFFRADISETMGGSFESTYLLASNLGSKWESTLLFSGDGRAVNRAESYGLTHDIVPFDPPFSPDIHEMSASIRKPLYASQIPRYFVQIVRFLRQREFDVVHVNDPITFYLWGTAGWFHGIPVIAHVRGEYHPSYRIRYVAQFADHLVFVSESTRDQFADAVPNGVSTSVLYNPVDIERFNPDREQQIRRELKISPETPLVGYVGDFVTRKRPMLFVEAAITYLERHEAQFVMAGNDKGGYTKQIRERAQKAGVADDITVLGFRNDVEDIMAALDIHVLTSTKTGEAFPRTPLEAMSCGTPVVTTDSAGVSEAVVDGETGFVLPVDVDPETIATCLERLLQNKGLYADFATQARDHVRTNFSAAKLGSELSNLYDTYLM